MPDAGAREIAARVLARLDAVIARLGTAYLAVPEYAALPEGALENEVLPVSREIVGTFLDAVVAGREPAVDAVPAIEVMGRRRLEMGVPLEPMLHVYRIAGREVFDEIAAASGPGEKDALAELGRAWMDYMDRASSAAASSYLHASHERLRRIDAERGALLDSLLAAEDASGAAAVAAQFAVALASRYAPVLIAAPGVATRVDRVTAAAPAESLTGFRGAHVLVLAPDTVPDLDALAAEVPGAIAAHGEPAEPGSALRAEVQRVQTVLAAALARGAPGWYGRDDLLLERLARADSTVADALRRTVVDPIRAADRGGLVESTLRSFLRTGSVPQTAAAEVVHPNTVAYRLRTVAERVGLDPRVPEQAAVLVTALLADDIVRSTDDARAD